MREGRDAHTAGWQLAAHVIGDRAIDHWLLALEDAQRAAPWIDARHQLEHFAICRDDAVERVPARSARSSFHSTVSCAGWADHSRMPLDRRAHSDCIRGTVSAMPE